MSLQIARELEVNVVHRAVHGGKAIKTHRKVTNNLSHFMQQVGFFKDFLSQPDTVSKSVSEDK